MNNKDKLIIELKYKYYKNIIDKYEIFFYNLTNIFNNIPYNNKPKKIKKHFPVNIYNNIDEYKNKFKNNNDVSFSILLGDIELQKDLILKTIERRYNGITVIKDNLKQRVADSYYYKKNYDLDIGIFFSNLDDIILYNTEELIKKHYPEFIRKTDNSVMFKYVYSIRTENIHHYIDLINNKLCDRILICGDEKTFNIMFKNTKDIIYNNINQNEIKDNINNYVENVFNNKLLNISNFSV
jgi:hypothetical protein